MENIARMIVDIADMYPSAITLTGHVYMDVSGGINNQRVHKVRILIMIHNFLKDKFKCCASLI